MIMFSGLSQNDVSICFYNCFGYYYTALATCMYMYMYLYCMALIVPVLLYMYMGGFDSKKGFKNTNTILILASPTL